MCLVEVEKSPKLVPACVGTVADGMVVHTESENALKAREGVLEFYLVNHPLDCPVCDQSGECKLQDYVAAEGPAMGRSKEPKRVLGKDDFGGDVIFYADRCVMCTRCVRFMREVAQDERLTVVQRGSRNVIDTFFEEGLDRLALGRQHRRHLPGGRAGQQGLPAQGARLGPGPHPLRLPQLHPGVQHPAGDPRQPGDAPQAAPQRGGQRPLDVRLRPPQLRWINRVDRIEAPLVRDAGAPAVPVSWSDALTRLADALRGHAGGARAVVSPFMANEDLGRCAG
jgi:NADH-quinone oxidoreductase subunit G